MSNLDSRSKRASSVGILLGFLLAPVLPDGTIAQADRQHIAWSYSGIAAAVGEMVTGVPLQEAGAIIEYALSNGLLAAAEGDLYQVPVLRQAELLSLILHNIHASNSNDVELFLQPEGASSRQFVNKEVAAGETLLVEEMDLNEGDKIRGNATSANEVTWTISVEERFHV